MPGPAEERTVAALIPAVVLNRELLACALPIPLDVDDVAFGYVTKLRWNEPGKWIWSEWAQPRRSGEGNRPGRGSVSTSCLMPRNSARARKRFFATSRDRNAASGILPALSAKT